MFVAWESNEYGLLAKLAHSYGFIGATQPPNPSIWPWPCDGDSIAGRGTVKECLIPTYHLPSRPASLMLLLLLPHDRCRGLMHRTGLDWPCSVIVGQHSSTILSACPWLFLFPTQVLTVSATRVNEVKEFLVTFTGDTTNDGGVQMGIDATANAVIDLTFDSGNMNWACSDTTETTSLVRNPQLREVEGI